MVGPDDHMMTFMTSDFSHSSRAATNRFEPGGSGGDAAFNKKYTYTLVA